MLSHEVGLQTCRRVENHIATTRAQQTAMDVAVLKHVRCDVSPDLVLGTKRLLAFDTLKRLGRRCGANQTQLRQAIPPFTRQTNIVGVWRGSGGTDWYKRAFGCRADTACPILLIGACSAVMMARV